MEPIFRAKWSFWLQRWGFAGSLSLVEIWHILHMPLIESPNKWRTSVTIYWQNTQMNSAHSDVPLAQASGVGVASALSWQYLQALKVPCYNQVCLRMGIRINCHHITYVIIHIYIYTHICIIYTQWKIIINHQSRFLTDTHNIRTCNCCRSQLVLPQQLCTLNIHGLSLVLLSAIFMSPNFQRVVTFWGSPGISHDFAILLAFISPILLLQNLEFRKLQVRPSLKLLIREQWLLNPCWLKIIQYGLYSYYPFFFGLS